MIALWSSMEGLGAYRLPILSTPSYHPISSRQTGLVSSRQRRDFLRNERRLLDEWDVEGQMIAIGWAKVVRKKLRRIK